jgi:hypothetical protein
LRDRTDEAPLDGEGREIWLDYECEAARYGVDSDISREELANLIDASTCALSRDERRQPHESDFVRWGRRGGLATRQRYERAWFGLLALRRWGRVAPAALDMARQWQIIAQTSTRRNGIGCYESNASIFRCVLRAMLTHTPSSTFENNPHSPCPVDLGTAVR